MDRLSYLVVVWNEYGPAPRGGRSGELWPPWRYHLLTPAYGGQTKMGPASLAHNANSMLFSLSPADGVVAALEEIEALAAVDVAVQTACEMVAEEIQPCLDEDEDDVLAQILWANAEEIARYPTAIAGVKCLLRSGPTLIAATQWALQNLVDSSVLRLARSNASDRRRGQPQLDARLRSAAQAMAGALPEQKAPLALAALVVEGVIVTAWAADEITYAITDHYLF